MKKRSALEIVLSWFSPHAVLKDPVFNLRMKTRLLNKRLIKTIGQAEYDRLMAEVTLEEAGKALEECNKTPLSSPPPKDPNDRSLFDEVEIVLAAIWEDAINKVIIIVCNVVYFYVLFKMVVFLLSH